MKRRVIFSGSRNWRHETSVVDALMELNPNEWIVVTGGAKGLDTLAERYAKQLGFEVEVYRANWRLHGKSAGPVRNRLMLSRPDVELVVAFPDHEKGKGTQDMMKIAKEVGIRVVEVSKP